MNTRLLEAGIGKLIDLGVNRLARSSLPSRAEQIERRLARLEALESAGVADNGPEDFAPEGHPAAEEVSTGCLPCARAHLSTVAGTLKEALRFAREKGMGHPEVQSRLQTAEEDITVIERHDWTPEKLLRSPEDQRRAMQSFIPRLRALRQQVIQIASVADLEQAAAAAGELSTDLRVAVLRLRGVDAGHVGRVMELARRVDAGELSLEEAKQELRAEMDAGDEPCDTCAAAEGG